MTTATPIYPAPELPCPACGADYPHNTRDCLDARDLLEKQVGQVWNTDELQRDFDVLGFQAPCVAVVRKADGRAGSVWFRTRPCRLYYSFNPDPSR